jgi:DNA mismatch repair protein MutL
MGGSPPVSIRVLDEKTINKIAAGEVVERPAAAVRELIQNSIDADATEIFIELESGGKKLLRVRDNGIGMTKEDAELSLQRHATSKIRSDKDLFSIHSLGFRGEAVPSIASVSRFEMITRTKDASNATKILVDGGNHISTGPAAGALGTQISVRNLFYNVPVRQKFLRTDGTELSHILDAVNRELLIRPHIDIEVRHNRSTVLRAPTADSLESRAEQILGNQAKGLIPVQGEFGSVQVHGVISPVGVHRATGGNNSYLYVNKRFVKDTALRRAIKEAYQGLIPKGRFPTVILLVSLPPMDVDVNVHPAKTEVRFKFVKELTSFLVKTIRGVLQERGIKRAVEARPAVVPSGLISQRSTQAALWEPDRSMAVRATPDSVHTISKDLFSSSDSSSHGPLMVGEDAAPSWNINDKPPVADASRTEGVVKERESLVFPDSLLGFLDGVPTYKKENHDGNSILESYSSQLPTWPKEKYEMPMEVEKLLPVPRFQDLRVIGQLSTTYILCEGAGELVIIDQHAAHERITLFAIMQNAGQAVSWGQRLLTPILVDLNPARFHALQDSLELLYRFGFEIAPFGGSTMAIRQVPPILEGVDWTRLIEDVADDIAQGGSGAPLEERLQLKFATQACHNSIRAGDRLSQFRMNELLEELDGVDFGVCAHGRPVAIRIENRELEKRFHRS